MLLSKHLSSQKWTVVQRKMHRSPAIDTPQSKFSYTAVQILVVCGKEKGKENLHAYDALDVLEVGKTTDEVVDFAGVMDEELYVAVENAIAGFNDQFVHVDAMLL